MKIFKGGFKSGACYSVNMIWANTGKEEREAVEVREIIDPDGIHKRTIAKSGTAYIVTFFEMMGGRWVPLSSPERWSPELVQEMVEA